MADRVTKEIRSYNMSKIKGKNTSIELKVRHYLFHHGFRYKINVKDLPGCITSITSFCDSIRLSGYFPT